MKAPDLSNQWALITGASSGFGVDFAHLLAQRGMHLVLTARREDRLNALAAELHQQYKTEVRIFAQDLNAPDGVASLHQAVLEQKIELEVLINNAGFGLWGPFLDAEWSDIQQMLKVDIQVLTELSHRFGREMRDRGHGYILQVASIGAYQPSPLYAAYSAAKAYVLSLGEAMAEELKGSGVSVSVLSPGVTRTEFLEVAGQQANAYQRMVMMESRPVAETGLKALFRGKPSVVPGIGNKLTIFSTHFLPRILQAKTAHLLMQ